MESHDHRTHLARNVACDIDTSYVDVAEGGTGRLFYFRLCYYSTSGPYNTLISDKKCVNRIDGGED